MNMLSLGWLFIVLTLSLIEVWQLTSGFQERKVQRTNRSLCRSLLS